MILLKFLVVIVTCSMNDNTISTKTYKVDLILIGHTSLVEKINTVKDGEEN